jgi:hypothetical protein
MPIRWSNAQNSVSTRDKVPSSPLFATTPGRKIV